MNFTTYIPSVKPQGQAQGVFHKIIKAIADVAEPPMFIFNNFVLTVQCFLRDKACQNYSCI